MLWPFSNRNSLRGPALGALLELKVAKLEAEADELRKRLSTYQTNAFDHNKLCYEQVTELRRTLLALLLSQPNNELTIGDLQSAVADCDDPGFLIETINEPQHRLRRLRAVRKT